MITRLLMAIAMLSGLAGAASAQMRFETETGPVALEVVAEGLNHPWSLAFLPDGRMLVTEREGQLRIAGADGVLSAPIMGVPAVAAVGQGGLLDVVLSPSFAEDRLVYLSFSEPRDAGSGASVMRGRLSADDTRLDDVAVIFRQQPSFGGGYHFGSRLVFDRSGALFITTGDRNGLRAEVQGGGNTIGKIVRVTADGGVPTGNPKPSDWLPEIWSMGHRNIQGAALHPETGALWTVEHGPRGGDELNRPEAGKNYGWPVISYGTEYSGDAIGEATAKAGMKQPVHYWDPSISPSGLAFVTGDVIPGWTGNLLTGSLSRRHVARLVMADGAVVHEEQLFPDVARFRDVRQGPDGYVYLLTDAGGGEGRILKIVPAL